MKRPTDCNIQKILRVLFCIMLASLLVLGPLLFSAEASGKYADCSPTHIYYNSICKMEELGVVKGTSSSTIAPDRQITKAEYITLLVRLFQPDVEISPLEPWYEPYRKAVLELGYFPEESLTDFEQTLSWTQILPSSMRAAELYPHVPSSFSSEQMTGIPEILRACVYTLMDAGILQEDFKLFESPTRGQVIDYLYQLYGTDYNGASTDIYLPASEIVLEVPFMQFSTSTVASERANRSGMTGRWHIPAVDIDVATFASNEQWVVDAKDSAARFFCGAMEYIGDHNYQSFYALKDCEIGDYAYFDDGEIVMTYICTDKFTGHNIKTGLTDDNYRSIEYDNPGGLTCYTCRGNSHDVWILFFQPV